MKLNDKINISNRGIEFIEHVLLRYDTSKLLSITVSKTERKKFPARGFCRKAIRSHNWYTILVLINDDETLYPCKYLHIGKEKSTNKRGYKSIKKYYIHRNAEEALIETVLHEIFHFLSWTKQVKLGNTEANANEWAYKRLNEFRRYYKLNLKTVKQNGNKNTNKIKQVA